MRTIEEVEAEVRKYDPWIEKVLAYDGRSITIQVLTDLGDRWTGTFAVVPPECA